MLSGSYVIFTGIFLKSKTRFLISSKAISIPVKDFPTVFPKPKIIFGLFNFMYESNLILNASISFLIGALGKSGLFSELLLLQYHGLFSCLLI